jgi:hypothetical protein
VDSVLALPSDLSRKICILICKVAAEFGELTLKGRQSELDSNWELIQHGSSLFKSPMFELKLARLARFCPIRLSNSGQNYKGLLESEFESAKKTSNST